MHLNPHEKKKNYVYWYQYHAFHLVMTYTCSAYFAELLLVSIKYINHHLFKTISPQIETEAPLILNIR